MRHSRWRGSCAGGTGHMIVDALDRAVGAVIVDAEHGGAAQDAHLRQRRQLRLDLRDPFGRGRAVDRVALREQPAAEPEILLAQDHARAGSRRPRAPPAGPAGPPPITSTSQCAYAFS